MMIMYLDDEGMLINIYFVNINFYVTDIYVYAIALVKIGIPTL